MNKKISILLVLIMATLLMVTFSFAQTPREGTSSEGKTTFTSIAVVGLSQDSSDGVAQMGLPGYIEMVSTAGSTYYLYIDANGVLRLASAQVVGYGASPSITGWGNGASALTVGIQTP